MYSLSATSALIGGRTLTRKRSRTRRVRRKSVEVGPERGAREANRTVEEKLQMGNDPDTFPAAANSGCDPINPSEQEASPCLILREGSCDRTGRIVVRGG